MEVSSSDSKKEVWEVIEDNVTKDPKDNGEI